MFAQIYRSRTQKKPQYVERATQEYRVIKLWDVEAPTVFQQKLTSIAGNISDLGYECIEGDSGKTQDGE